MTARAGLVAVLALALAPGCGTGGGEAPVDAPPRDPPPPCAAQSMTLGGCATDAGGPCTGALGEVRRFAPLAAGGEVALVVGPQASTMLVFSARTTGITAGDVGDPASPANPRVELVVARADLEVASYRGRIAFADDGAGALVAAGLFALTEGPSLAGQALVVHGRLVDVAGLERCGEVEFVAR